MKKIVALLLTLVMLSSLTLTALAAGEQTGTTTITAEVPGPTYTMVIPADMTLEYGNTEAQKIGDISVSNVVGITDRYVMCHISVTDLTSAVGTIPVKYTVDGLEVDESFNEFEVYDHTIPGYVEHPLYAKVTYWGSAAPGTYTATITFNFSIS